MRMGVGSELDPRCIRKRHWSKGKGCETPMQLSCSGRHASAVNRRYEAKAPGLSSSLRLTQHGKHANNA